VSIIRQKATNETVAEPEPFLKYFKNTQKLLILYTGNGVGLLQAYWCSKGEVADKEASSSITYVSMGSIRGVRHQPSSLPPRSLRVTPWLILP
jgi:hypothetical protein